MANLIIDVSSYQPDTLDFFKAAAKKGAKAVVVKITEGSNPGTAYVNPKAEKQIANAKKAGLKVHGYHFADFRGTADAKAEAAWFIKNAKACGLKSDSVMVLDIENGAVNANPATADANTFLSAVKAAGYPKVAVYSMRSWFTSGRLSSSIASVWVAEYGASKPGMTSFKAWQFTDSLIIDGVKTDASYDYGLFTGEKKAPNFGAKSSLPTLIWHKENATFTADANINMRELPSTSAKIKAVLKKGQSVKYNAWTRNEGYTWIRQPRSGGGYYFLAVRDKSGAFGSFE